jgi:hypothetical protein
MSLRTRLKTAFESAILDIADEFQQNSPVGATGLLKSSWDVNVTENTNGLVGIIVNNAPASRYRALGRGSGGFPPIEPLTDWVKVKIEPDEKKAKAIAFLIGRKIAREGTERFKNNQNPFYLNRDMTKKDELNQLFINKLRQYLGD